MHKKQRKKLNQRRDKTIDQNARAQARTEKRRREMADFGVDVVERDDFTPELVVALGRNQVCFFCGEAIGDDQVVSGQFVALCSKAKNFYFLHSFHVYEADLKTPLPEMQKNLSDGFMKIFEAEKGHLFGSTNKAKPAEKPEGEKKNV